MQTHLNKFLFLFFLLIPSISYSAGTITDNSDLLFTESIIENDEIITSNEYSSDPRFYQLLSAENCDVLYNEIDFSRFNTQNLNVQYDNIIKSIILRPKEFKYNINFLEQSFKFQAKEMNTALFQFQSFDMNILKEMNEVKKNIEENQSADGENAIICEYNLLENIEINKFPDLSINFENAQIIDIGSISSKINVYYDGTVEYFFKNYTYQFDKSNFDLSKFPFDSHNIQTVIRLNMDNSAKVSPSSYYVKKFNLLNQNNFTKFLPQLTSGDTFVDIEIQHTNICNLKCGMCYEKNTHSLAAENRQLGISNSQLVYNWDIAKVTNKISDTKWLNIRGGEPLINQELQDQVNLWIEEGLLDNTTLCITTNATKPTIVPKIASII